MKNFKVLLISLLLMGSISCKKKEPKDDVKTMEIVQLPSIFKFKTSTSILITDNGRILSRCSYISPNIIYISDHNQSNWQTYNPNFFTTSMYLLKNGNVLLSTWSGVMILDINTLSATPTNINTINASGIFAQAEDETVYYLETTSGKLFRSNDNGLNWVKTNAASSPLAANSDCRIYTKQNKVLLTERQNGILYISADKGESFTVLSSDLQYSTFPIILSFSPTGEILTSNDRISKDGGNTWQKFSIDPGDASQHVNEFLFTSDGKILATPAYDSYNTNGIYFSNSGLSGFKRLGSYSMCPAAINGNIIALGGQILLVSTDGGNTFKSAGIDRDPTIGLGYMGADMNLLSQSDGILPMFRLVNNEWLVDWHTSNGTYYETSGYRVLIEGTKGGYYSTDEGNTWTKFNNNALEYFPLRIIAHSIIRRNGELYAISQYSSTTPVIDSKIFKFNKSTLKFDEVVSNISLAGSGFVENANGNFFTKVNFVIDGSIYKQTQYKSTDGGANWFENLLEYDPICFNSTNNFVANGKDQTIWFSDVADSKIYNYKMSPSLKFMEYPVFFDKNDYLYFSGYGNNYKSKLPQLKP